MSKKFGIVAEYKDPAALVKAAEGLRDAGYTVYDAHSPFPIHGMDDAMGLPDTKLPWPVLFGGLTGLTAGLGLQYWASVEAYALTISGKPYFSFLAFIPVTFEVMVLFSAITAVVSIFIFCGLPRLHHPLFSHEPFEERVSSHGFFISVEATDPKFDDIKTKELLKKLGGEGISDVDE